MPRLSRIHSSNVVKFIGKSVEEISSQVIFKADEPHSPSPSSALGNRNWQCWGLGQGSISQSCCWLASKPVLLSSPRAPRLGSWDIHLAVSPIPRAKTAMKPRCSRPWFWANRQVAVGQQTCRDCLKWPSLEAWPAAGWTLHSSRLEIREAELLWKPGPSSSAVPPKPPGLVLGTAAWADVPGLLQSHGWCSSLGWDPHPWPGSNIPALSWGGPSPAKGSVCGSPLILQQRSLTARTELLLMSLPAPGSWVGLLGSARNWGDKASGKWMCSGRAWPDQGYCGAVGSCYSITCMAPARWLISR